MSTCDISASKSEELLEFFLFVQERQHMDIGGYMGGEGGGGGL